MFNILNLIRAESPIGFRDVPHGESQSLPSVRRIKFAAASVQSAMVSSSRLRVGMMEQASPQPNHRLRRWRFRLIHM